MKKIYYESLSEAIERNKTEIASTKKRLEDAGVKYVLSSWIDMHGIPKTKPVPMSDFEALCMGKGPQFAVHSVSFVPELTPADPDQIMLPDLNAVYICPWDKTTAIIFADLFWENALMLGKFVYHQTIFSAQAIKLTDLLQHISFTLDAISTP